MLIFASYFSVIFSLELTSSNGIKSALNYTLRFVKWTFHFETREHFDLRIIYWYWILTAFSIHLIIHFLQFVIWKKYIPAIITTILCIPYCIFAIEKASYILTFKELFIYAVVGIIIGAVNLLVMHRFAFNWYKKVIPTNGEDLA